MGGLHPHGVDIDLFGEGIEPFQNEYYPVPLDVAADGSFVSFNILNINLLMILHNSPIECSI